MKVVVLADDEGARMRPLTRTRPKAMLPVAGRPILEHVLDTCTDTVDGYVIVVGHRPETVHEYFGDSYDDKPVDYVSVADRTGPAHAIARAEPHLDGTTLVLPGDRLVPRPLLDRLTTGRPPALAITPDETTGVTRSDTAENHLRSNSPREAANPDAPVMANDSATTPIAFLLSPSIVESIESDTPRPDRDDDLRTTMERRQPTGASIRVVQADENHTRVTYPWNLLEASATKLSDMNSAIDGRVGHTATLLGETHIETGVRVRNGTYIEGPVRILSGADVGPNAFVKGPTVVGPNVRIGNAAAVEHSICMDDVTVDHHSTVRHSVLGAGTEIGANTTVANRPRQDDTVVMTVGNELVDTERERLGVILGDRAETAIGTNLGAGIVLGPDETTTPGETCTTDHR